MLSLYWNLALLFGFALSMDIIKSTSTESMDHDIFTERVEKNLLLELGISNPDLVPTTSKDDIMIPEDIRATYSSMLRAHRSRRMISKGIRKNPGKIILESC